MLIIRYNIKFVCNTWKFWKLLSNEFHIVLHMFLRNHIGVQIYFTNSPLPVFSNITILTYLSFRTKDLRVGPNCCSKPKPGFYFGSCDIIEICKKYMPMSTLLFHIRGPSICIAWNFAAEFVFVLQFRMLPYPVFHGYDVIALQLSTFEGAFTRYLVGSCRSLCWIFVVVREDLNLSLFITTQDISDISFADNTECIAYCHPLIRVSI